MTDGGYKFARYGDIRVAYRANLDGGGRGFGQSFVPVVRDLTGKVGRVYEFCAGPGFIGFSLLANGLCDSLCLSDINPEAVEAARATVRRNGLETRVAVYESDGLGQIPAEEKWDLVVSNPPHFRNSFQDSIRHHDPDWDIHRRFYAGIARHLRPGGSVLLQENYAGSEDDEFDEMISCGRLRRIASFMHTDRRRKNFCDSYFFLWSRLVNDSVELRNADSICYANGSPKEIHMQLRAGTVQHLNIESFTRYRFCAVNEMQRDLTILVYAMKFGCIPRFLRTFAKLTDGRVTAECVFQFCPGRYFLCDQQSKQTFCTLRVT
jgi:SAM-dependent methyltransferase